jgi:hypothetical protein
MNKIFIDSLKYYTPILVIQYAIKKLFILSKNLVKWILFAEGD